MLILDPLVVDGRIFRHVSAVDGLVELRIAIADEDLERVRRRLLQRARAAILRRHADLELARHAERRAALRAHHTALGVDVEAVSTTCNALTNTTKLI